MARDEKVPGPFLYSFGDFFPTKTTSSTLLKGTVSLDYTCLEVISIKSPLLGHVTPDI
jgi:hypothetical protein